MGELTMKGDFVIRQAIATDVEDIFGLIQALAEYEKLSHTVTGNSQDLRKDLFGDSPCAEAIVAVVEGKIVGFGLFFQNYSTFLTKPGIYLEDLFVLPKYRRRGIAKGILKYLVDLAIARDAGRLEWSVLDWNQDAIAFYEKIGAQILPDWRICRLTGNALVQGINL